MVRAGRRAIQEERAMMSSRSRWLVAVMAVLAMCMGTGATAAEAPATSKATETLLISAGCPQDTPGTCTSTRWLGTSAGSATSNFLTSTTPADAALHAAGQEPTWRDYVSNNTLKQGGYVLDASEPLTATVSVSANGIGLQNNVDARISARIDGKTVAFAAQRQTIDLLPGETKAVTFTWDIPEGAKILDRMTFETRVFGFNAQAGYIDQKGGSTVVISHLVPAE
jgi:hypothetical protein